MPAFGHTGEEALSPYFPMTGGWHHAAQSVRIFEALEDLNLSWEVRDGIRAHSWKIDPPPATQEALCVRYADRIAHTSPTPWTRCARRADPEADFPGAVIAQFRGARAALDRPEVIEAVIEQSLLGAEVTMDPDTLAVMHELRHFMFDRVYLSAGQRERTSGGDRPAAADGLASGPPGPGARHYQGPRPTG
ncbi:MAG: hypothetical protein U0869_04055 [Chloroflexota bacterium]